MNRCNTCKHSTRNGGDGWSACDGCIHDSELQDRYAPATNADHIRSMTDEELAGFVFGISDMTYDYAESWLKQPYKEDNDGR